ncbi:MAG: ABC transporter substrate-binding protein [Sporichthyaceae bacterium]|nr:ABC transporter substrate-binding protein [Sporichthyaceae bacterium]
MRTFRTRSGTTPPGTTLPGVFSGLIMAVALVLSGCAGDDTEPAAGSPSPSTAAFPVVVTDGAGKQVTLSQRPEAIVSLAPTPTEMLYAIGAGSQVTAVDSLSNFPAGAPRTELSGFEPNVEAIAAENPDLVVLTDDIQDVVAGLDALNIPVLQLPAAATLDDTYAQLGILGKATGHDAEAAAVVDRMRSDIQQIVAGIPQREDPLTYYHELDDTLFTVTSQTFIGQIYALAGLENVADPAGAAGGPYPQLSSEFLVDADPDLIFLADTKCCGQSAETLAQRRGFGQLSAVTGDRVVSLDDDIASRWGPRVVDFLRVVADAVANVPAAATTG